MSLPEKPLAADGHQILECLAILAKESGRRTNVAALTAGLPPPKNGLVTSDLLARAAERAGMSVQAAQRSLSDLAQSSPQPCILALKNHRACVLKAISPQEASVIFPETPGGATEIMFSELEKIYDGRVFFVMGRVAVDERAGPLTLKFDKDWFWGPIGKQRRIYHQVALAALLINLFALVIPLFTMTVYDRILPNKALDTLWVLATGVVIALGFDFVLKTLRARFLDAAGKKSDIAISADIFEHIQGMRMSARPPNAGVLVDSMRGFETLRDFFTSATVSTLVDLPFTLLFVILIGVLGGPIVLVPLILVAVIAGFGYMLQKPLSKAVEENSREIAYKNSVLMETLSGLETIKVRGAESYNQRKWEDIVAQSARSSVRSRALASLGANFTGMAANLCTVGIILWGAHMFADGDLTSGALVACVILSGRVVAPLAQIAGVLTRFNQSRTALERLDTVMKKPVEREKGRALVSRPVLTGHLAFQNVTFRYPGQQADALRHISLEIRPGDRVGVIGTVGSGKTTLQRLIMNLYQPDHGSIEADGLDLRQIEPADLRRNIGVAQQDAYMFFGSVRDNITLGHESMPEEAVLRAAEASGVTAFLKQSPSGLDTPVGERGERLSGGQRQAVALARALLYDPPILILDEPTASVDPQSEKLLYERLMAICEKKTVILITHRHEMLGLVNKLAVMDKGQIAGYGPRDEVLRRLKQNPAPTDAGDGKKT